MEGFKLILQGIEKLYLEQDEKAERRHRELLEALRGTSIQAITPNKEVSHVENIEEDNKKDEEEKVQEENLTKEEVDKVNELADKFLQEEKNEKTEKTKKSRKAKFEDEIKIPGMDEKVESLKEKIEKVDEETANKVIEKPLYDAPEDEKKDYVETSLGADSNEEPFAIVSEETKEEAAKAVENAKSLLDDLNNTMEDVSLEGDNKETEKVEEKENDIEEATIIEEEKAEENEAASDTETEVEKEIDLETQVLELRETIKTLTTNEKLLSLDVEVLETIITKNEDDIEELTTQQTFLRKKVIDLLEAAERGEIQKIESSSKDTEESEEFNEKREFKIKGLDEELEEMALEILEAKGTHPSVIFNGEIKLKNDDTIDWEGETLHRIEYIKETHLYAKGELKDTITVGTLMGYASKEALIGKNVCLYEGVIIKKGAIIAPGTTLYCQEIDNPLVVEEYSFVPSATYITQKKLDSKMEELDYSVREI